MRVLALGLPLLAAGCGSLTIKLHPFHLSPGQSDVLWLQRGLDIYRCSNTHEGPACVLAPFTRAPEPPEPEKPTPTKAPALD